MNPIAMPRAWRETGNEGKTGLTISLQLLRKGGAVDGKAATEPGTHETVQAGLFQIGQKIYFSKLQPSPKVTNQTQH